MNNPLTTSTLATPAQTGDYAINLQLPKRDLPHELGHVFEWYKAQENPDPSASQLELGITVVQSLYVKLAERSQGGVQLSEGSGLILDASTKVVSEGQTIVVYSHSLGSSVMLPASTKVKIVGADGGFYFSGGRPKQNLAWTSSEAMKEALEKGAIVLSGTKPVDTEEPMYIHGVSAIIPTEGVEA